MIMCNLSTNESACNTFFRRIYSIMTCFDLMDRLFSDNLLNLNELDSIGLSDSC